MFELTLALRYLVPRKKALSTALISLLSVFVISLVVWLVLVFLSVTSGIEQSWLQKLTSLHAPIRLTPTENYYQSYYYLSDSLSAGSNYTPKTIGEKAESITSDPHSESTDAQIPSFWPPAQLHANGRLVDPVKEAYQILNNLNLRYQDYEISGALLRLTLSRPTSTAGAGATLSQMSFLLSFMDQNPRFATLILPPSADDLEAMIKKADPKELDAILANIAIDDPSLRLLDAAQLIKNSHSIAAKAAPRISFDKPPKIPPPWTIIISNRCYFPPVSSAQPFLIPKSYRDMGVRIGDRGTLNFASVGAAVAQEQRINVQVAGFYDPGLFSMGGRCLVVPKSITRTIHAASQTFSPDGTPTNGISVWAQNPDQIQKLIEDELSKANLSSFWKVSTYKDFEFSKELFQQFRSDRTLFLLIALLILLVACCNIISLLVLLVNDKKREIAILQAMGASMRSIAGIFALCGLTMGALSSLIGTLAAIFTLRHLDSLVAFLSFLQGHAAFQPAFFGHSLPNQLSSEALLFVLIATPLLSLFAGLFPAIRACRIRAASALRQE